ncbi:MAG: cyclopropane fatty acyl phospholipid synthase [Bacteroidota bacterium]
MAKTDYKTAVQNLLQEAGIEINGKQSWDILVKNENFYQAVFSRGSLGFGETYMEGWWECRALDKMFHRLFRANLEEKIKSNFRLKLLWLKSKIFNQQTKSKALKSVGSHYNIGNDLYKKMLDPLMVYSCGYWKDAKDLAEAQRHKLELICQKLKLKKGQTVLDIGCGWGGFAKYAAENYGVTVTGITISEEQQKLAAERCQGLPVEIRFQDYRDVDEKYDRIVSIGMLEHVGHKNFESFMQVIKRALKTDGISLVHFIGGNFTKYHTDPWINKYIFPQGLIPSVRQIGQAMERKLILEDWHNFGLYYDHTLMAWMENFKQAWPELKSDYSDIFYRMWEFYLNSSAAAFRAKKLNLWQLVLTHPHSSEIYQSLRPETFSASPKVFSNERLN